MLTRLVVTGAAFSDDGAADARRGVPHAGVDLADLVLELFPGRDLLAFVEDGHPEDIPDGAFGIEAYEGYRAGGAVTVGLVRWARVVRDRAGLVELFGDSPEERLRGLCVLRDDTELDGLLDDLFPLVGASSLDSPPCRFQPGALPDILDRTDAVLLFHRDKHGVALGVYARQLPASEAILRRLADAAGALHVPFGIAPMLARWDRALSELRAVWPVAELGPFPVPPAPPEARFQSRRRRRGRGEDALALEEGVDDLLDVADDVADEAATADGSTELEEDVDGEDVDEVDDVDDDDADDGDDSDDGNGGPGVDDDPDDWEPREA